MMLLKFFCRRLLINNKELLQSISCLLTTVIVLVLTYFSLLYMSCDVLPFYIRKPELHQKECQSKDPFIIYVLNVITTMATIVTMIFVLILFILLCFAICCLF